MLKIQVTGHCATGKTTIAAIIEKALQDHGINVHNTDPDKVFGTDYMHNQEMRVAAVAKRSKSESVLIETVQLHRNLHNPEHHE